MSAPYTPPAGFTLDPNSGLYYRITPRTGPGGQAEQLVTWFYPNTGEFQQVAYPAEPVSYQTNPAASGSLPAGKKKKKPGFWVAIVSVVVLFIAAGLYDMYVRQPERENIGSGSGFESTLPTDADGNNLVGNSMENLKSGGLIAAQGKDVFFVNFEDGGTLYCQDRNGELTKLTDFPVANLNIRGDALLFTGLSNSSYRNAAGQVMSISARTHQEIWNAAGSKQGITYGGDLYAVSGIRAYNEGYITIDELEAHILDTGYEGIKQPVFTEAGLVMLPAGAGGIDGTISSLLFYCMTYCDNVLREYRITANDNESIVGFIVIGETAFVEVHNEWDGYSYIIRCELKNGELTKAVLGHSLMIWLGHPVFIDALDGLVYLWDVEMDEVHCLSGLTPVNGLLSAPYFHQLDDYEQGLAFWTRLDNGSQRLIYLVAVPNPAAVNLTLPAPFVMANEQSFPLEKLGFQVFSVMVQNSGPVYRPGAPDQPVCCGEAGDCNCVDRCVCGDGCECPHNVAEQEIGADRLWFLDISRPWIPYRDRGRQMYPEPIGPRLPPDKPPGGGENQPEPKVPITLEPVTGIMIIEVWLPPTTVRPGTPVTPGGQNTPQIPGGDGGSGSLGEDCLTGEIFSSTSVSPRGDTFQYWFLPNGEFRTSSQDVDVNNPADVAAVRDNMSDYFAREAAKGLGAHGIYSIVGNKVFLMEYDSEGIADITGIINDDGSLTIQIKNFPNSGYNIVEYELTYVFLTCAGPIPPEIQTPPPTPQPPPSGSDSIVGYWAGQDRGATELWNVYHIREDGTVLRFAGTNRPFSEVKELLVDSNVTTDMYQKDFPAFYFHDDEYGNHMSGESSVEKGYYWPVSDPYLGECYRLDLYAWFDSEALKNRERATYEMWMIPKPGGILDIDGECMRID